MIIYRKFGYGDRPSRTPDGMFELAVLGGGWIVFIPAAVSSECIQRRVLLPG